ncbi:Gfo/Idh/MocA family protein [Adhaeretor mobilis]|uniref:Inositol 2-dehydrogenase/D-chiro-inositol 3-dehydrogenase n=1 Tax=Adhaeretor mobilis TaxID=1930276 RepID=A0A517MXB6_9BACT|nr:Gfo/Idh/MocA family oxidoreductase [Adhaeretor mobilis]QDS99509.1 Inositol 2-dehydrogenase/D-chiro-inositol 3-dehydrogenase [Adhaeretor mobilis]
MKLRVGVIGIGAAWQSRHLPALRALGDRYQVVAVCDPVQHRAATVAREVNANVCDGFRALTQRSDIDAVLLLSAKWFGSLPINAACDAGKAVYCSAALELEDAQAAQLRDRLQQAGVAFMAEFPCRLSPATLRLKELIATRLGKPRLLFCNRRRITSPTGVGKSRCKSDLVELIDWCRYLVEDEPTSLTSTRFAPPQQTLHNAQNDLPGAEYFSVCLDFSPADQPGAGPLATISCGDYIPRTWSESLAYRRPADLKIVCERGIAFIDLPNTLSWFDDAGHHLESLEHERPVGEQLLMHFHRAVESLILKSSSLDDAHRAICLANRALEHANNGQRVLC